MNAVTRMPSASVNRSCAPGWGRSLRRTSRVPVRPGGQVDQVGGLGDPGAVADAAVGVDRRIPALAEVEGVHGVLHPPIDGVAEGEPHPGGAAGGGEVVGGPGGVAAHQHPQACRDRRDARGRAATRARQRRQRLLQDGDVVSGGVGAGVAGRAAARPALPRRRSPGDPETPAADGARRTSSRSAPPFFVVGVVDDQGGVDVDMQPATRGGGGSGRPRRRPRGSPGRAHPGQVRGVDPFIDQPPHRGRRRFRTEHVLTVAAQLPDPVDAVRAVGDRGRQIGEHLPGRVHPRAAVGVRQRGRDLRR